MVQISQRNFNLDMDSYLTRRKKPEKKETKRKKKVKESTDEKEFKKEVEEYYPKKRSLFDKILDFIAGPPEMSAENGGVQVEQKVEMEIKEDVKEEPSEEIVEPVKRKGIIAMVKEWLFFDESTDDEKVEVEIEEQAYLISEDIKEVLKIQNKWLRRLPKRILKQFKESPDYDVYKETLKKHNLIKK